MIVVADLYQLKDRQNEVYQTKGTKVVERPGVKVEKSYVDRTNANSGVSGKMYIVDAEATEVWTELNEKHSKDLKNKQSKEKLGLSDVAQALIGKISAENDSLKSESEPRIRRTKEEIAADKAAKNG